MNRLAERVLVAAVCLACTAAFSSTAHAQVEAVRAVGPTGGVALPPTGAALADEATAASLNPAGLAQLRGPALFYLHERNIELDSLGDGVFLSQGFGGLSLGLSMQWLRTATGPDRRKTQWSLAVGDETVSLGASLNFFQSTQSDSLDALSTWDLGLLVRPWRYLSLGASVLDVDGDRLDGRRLPRRYDVGLGFRPFTDRVVLGADLLVDDVEGFDEARLAFTLRAEPLQGLVLLGGLGTGLSGDDLVGQLGLELDAPNFGAAYAFGTADGLSSGDHLVQLRLTAERYRSLPVGRHKYVVLDLEGMLTPTPSGFAALVAAGRDPYLDLLALLGRLRDDDSVAGVVLKIGGAGALGLARYQELHAALLELRGAGKRLVSLFFEGGDGPYLLASASERIYAVPQSDFMVNGLTASSVFFGAALRKLGVEIDVARVGQYKSAPEQLTRDDMSDPEREMLDAYLDSVFPRYLEAVAGGRKMPVEKLREAIDRGVLSAQLAVQAGLADEVLYPDELPDKLRALEGGPIDLETCYPGPDTFPRRWGGRPKIALIHIDGLIASGTSSPGFFGDATTGAQTVTEALQKVLDDDSVKALVLRIDSGGGSSLASDLIWRAVKKVRERKPVVVSMGDVAASGGYYVAAAADEILAEPATITGSIGVFALKPSFGPLLDKLGINPVTLDRGRSADLFSLSRSWTEDELRAVQQAVDESYQVFVDRVAEGRNLDKARVDQLGRGRIWSGASAKDVGLVDALGGLSDAFTRAKARAGLAGRETEVQVLGGRGMFELSMPSSQEQARLAKLLAQSGASKGLSLLELQETPLAVMPWVLEVR